jgi:hypothetical protein
MGLTIAPEEQVLLAWHRLVLTQTASATAGSRRNLPGRDRLLSLVSSYAPYRRTVVPGCSPI